MTYIDGWILNLTELFCHRLQILTGRTNVWMAFHLTNLSIVVYFVWAGTYIWGDSRAPRLIVLLFCGIVFYMLTQTVFRVSIDTYEASAYQRVAKGLRNPRRVRDAMLRIPFLMLSLVLAYPTVFVYRASQSRVIVLGYSLIVLTTVVLYLLACDPLPPSPGKVTEWLRSLVPSRVATDESP
jgi:hypothetical protein